MSKHYDHSRDMYIIGGVVLGLVVLGFIFFGLSGVMAPRPQAPTQATSSVSVQATSTTPVDSQGEDVSGIKVAEPVTALARCLAEKKAVMYGAYWCAHCQNQKRAFGSAWSLVPYVECPQNSKLCLQRGVDGYPTWIFADGQRIEGEASFEDLARVSGCPYTP